MMAFMMTGDAPEVTESLRTPLLDETQNEDEEAITLTSNPDLSHAPSGQTDNSDDNTSLWFRALHTQLLPEFELIVEGNYVVDGRFPIKLLKFVGLTFSMISLIHCIVKRYSDRDQSLQLRQIWMFEGNLIVTDCVIFFLVGRLWRQRGVDHLAWMVSAILCNVYFESQQLFSWLSHSVTLYEMHCVWPWQLWIFAGILIPLIGALVIFHAAKAYQERVLTIKLMEIGFFILFYLGPTILSPYFHFHHWFAGWLLGMHCNFDIWWSRAAMAWCWGMYINGIAVYGRDPVLTCEYAYFVATDNRCPFVETASSSNLSLEYLIQDNDMSPSDWRNCSASGYHP
jgi:hypothetical protein